MLDTHGRKYVAPLIKSVANVFIRLHFTANTITKIAFLVGIFSGILAYFEKEILAVIILWISGLLDAVDGEVARSQKDTTAWGTLMDITFDRIVELSIIIGLGLRFPNSRMELLFLSSAIIISMTVFLTVGALSEKKGMKSFYYQAGVMERTEGFILFSLMILFNKYLSIITIIYAVLVLFTAFQRLCEAKKILDN
ncbi:CDP-alcohol phosphatidyltransferase family protein [Anaerosalibacter sp. Marseille-P3206]|uniref:CDP-alcohol phosphatidyltransferase family protein n=1 Tax=Anaerosalibacter sp. Marseille-P3206 TaxID=1871005 RepID=UPI000984CC52|nr:CDP-alcohol phosphatidyltransferase family protein [Anaerosalibacter sp. Marseille-P3206]